MCRGQEVLNNKMNTKFFLEFIYHLLQSDSTTSVLPLSRLPVDICQCMQIIFGCRDWRGDTGTYQGDARNAVKHPTYNTLDRPYPPKRMIQPKMLVVLRLRNTVPGQYLEPMGSGSKENLSSLYQFATFSHILPTLMPSPRRVVWSW